MLSPQRMLYLFMIGFWCHLVDYLVTSVEQLKLGAIWWII